MAISDQLREKIRERRSVYIVAKESGISQAVLQRFNAGTRGLTLETVDKLAEFFGLVLVEAKPQAAERSAKGGKAGTTKPNKAKGR